MINVRTVTNPDDLRLDMIEASKPRLVRQSEPGKYVIVSGPPMTTDPSWHHRQSALYRDGAVMATNAKDAETMTMLADMHAKKGELR